MALFLGLLQTWATRDSIDLDVVSYLDMGDALSRGDWATGVNGTWNPLYGLLLYGVLRVAGPSPAHEYAVVHAAVFLIFVATVFAFGFFLRAAIALPPSSDSPGIEPVAVSARNWILLGYVLFTWSALDVIGVSATNPDMLVAGCVYAATALLIRVCRDPSRRGDFAWLGLVLGLAYLTKPFMFFGSLVFLGVAALVVARRGSLLKTVGLAFAVFLIVATPFVAALSYQRGHPTVSESGRVNYAWHVNGVTPRHWQGGIPVHPLRQILASPPTYELDRPIPVTYPYFYDLSYWYEGVRLAFRPTAHLPILRENTVEIAEIAYGPNGAFVVGLLILAALRPRWRSVAGWLGTNWHFIAPSAVALVLYALVHVEARYLGAFLVIILLGAFMALSAGGPYWADRLVGAIAVASWILLLLPGVGRATSPRYYSYLLHPSTKPVDQQQIPLGPSTASPWRVAAALSAGGVQPTDRVGTVQHAGRADAMWARLARVKIVSEIWANAPDQDFWRASPRAQEEAVEAMTRVGVRAIVSDSPPSGNANVIWHPLGETGYYVHWTGAEPVPARLP